MAGVAGLEPVTSAVKGQRSNQLSYTPAQGRRTLRKPPVPVKANKNIRAADAKEVGVGNPAEETYCRPNEQISPALPFLSIARKHHRGSPLIRLRHIGQLHCAVRLPKMFS